MVCNLGCNFRLESTHVLSRAKVRRLVKLKSSMQDQREGLLCGVNDILHTTVAAQPLPYG